MIQSRLLAVICAVIIGLNMPNGYRQIGTAVFFGIAAICTAIEDSRK